MKKYLIAGLGVLGLLTFSMTGCKGKKDKSVESCSSYVIPDSITTIQAIGRIQPMGGTIKLSSEVSGIIDHIYIASGDTVQKDQLLISTDPSVAKLNLKVSRQKLEQEESNLRISDLNIKKSELSLNEAKHNYEIAKRLFDKGAETRQNMIDRKNEFNQKGLELQKNLQEREITLKTIGELRESVQIAQENMSKCQIRAPKSGVILDVSAVVGNTIKEYEELALMCPNEPIVVEAEVDELFSNRLRLGDKVSVHNVGYSQVVATGKIIQMSDFLTQKTLFSGLNSEQQDSQIRKIKIMLDDQSHLPLIGSKVTCDILISQKNNK